MSGVCAVVGGQFGSEGKGLIVGEIARDYQHHVRVGAANAGHTLYTIDPERLNGRGEGDPEKHVMQQIPCAAYANPDASLYIGPGALITQSIFQRELDDLIRWRRYRGLPEALRLFVDHRAHLITEAQVHREQDTDLAARIGSTSTIAREGIGTAQADRVMRDMGCVPVGSVIDGVARFGRFEVADVAMRLGTVDGVLLEGTQGAGLSLTTGYFPYVTSRNTTAAGLCADTGVAPNRLDRVILVVRTYPIRVAGNSGPFHPESEETTWEEIGVDPDSQRTTVTKLVRRVATFSMVQAMEAAVLNGATEIALTFCDYLDPDLADAKGDLPVPPAGPVARLVDEIEDACQIPVRYLGTGPHSVIHLRDDR